jgi:uncharacterized protein (TIGR02444 family)
VERGSEFWRFSLTVYRMDGVPAACLSLQDRFGVDVNLMLFALWLASSGRAVSADDMRDADLAVADWRAQSVVALRGVRRYLRSPPAGFDSSAVDALRERIKAVELEAERLQQEALFALRPVAEWGRPESPDRAGEWNMRAYEASIGATFDSSARHVLLDAYQAAVGQRWA